MSEEVADLVFGEDGGKGLAVLDLDVTKDAPLWGDTQVIMIEDTQSDLGLIHGRRPVVLLLAEEDKVIADLILRKRGRISVEMLGKHANVRDIGSDCARGIVSKLDKLTITVQCQL
jgi:hypothetical protein